MVLNEKELANIPTEKLEELLGPEGPSLWAGEAFILDEELGRRRKAKSELSSSKVLPTND